jgi:hypothetical protein
MKDDLFINSCAISVFITLLIYFLCINGFFVLKKSLKFLPKMFFIFFVGETRLLHFFILSPLEVTRRGLKDQKCFL